MLDDDATDSDKWDCLTEDQKIRVLVAKLKQMNAPSELMFKALRSEDPLGDIWTLMYDWDWYIYEDKKCQRTGEAVKGFCGCMGMLGQVYCEHQCGERCEECKDLY